MISTTPSASAALALLTSVARVPHGVFMLTMDAVSHGSPQEWIVSQKMVLLTSPDAKRIFSKDFGGLLLAYTPEEIRIAFPDIWKMHISACGMNEDGTSRPSPHK